MVKMKSETSQVQAISSQFKGQSHSITIKKDESSQYGGKSTADQALTTMTQLLSKMDQFADQFGQCLSQAGQHKEQDDRAYGGK